MNGATDSADRSGGAFAGCEADAEGESAEGTRSVEHGRMSVLRGRESRSDSGARPAQGAARPSDPVLDRAGELMERCRMPWAQAFELAVWEASV